jgi:hypothetical protein
MLTLWKPPRQSIEQWCQALLDLGGDRVSDGARTLRVMLVDEGAGRLPTLCKGDFICWI